MWFNKGWICSVDCQIVLPVTTFNRLDFILFLSTAHFQIKSEESQSMPVTVSGSHSLMSTSADHSSLQPHSPVQSQADDHTDSNTKTDVQHDDDPNTMDEIKVRQFRNNTYHCIHLYIFCWVFECFFCCKNIVYQVIWVISKYLFQKHLTKVFTNSMQCIWGFSTTCLFK